MAIAADATARSPKLCGFSIHYEGGLRDFQHPKCLCLRITAQVDHSFRSKSTTDSDPSRPPVPTMSTTDSGDVDHSFRSSRPPVPVISTTLAAAAGTRVRSHAG